MDRKEIWCNVLIPITEGFFCWDLARTGLIILKLSKHCDNVVLHCLSLLRICYWNIRNPYDWLIRKCFKSISNFALFLLNYILLIKSVVAPTIMHCMWIITDASSCARVQTYDNKLQRFPLICRLTNYSFYITLFVSM